MNEPKKLYAAYEEHDEDSTAIKFAEFIVIAETPKCYKITAGTKTRLVLKYQSGKRFAYADHDGALRAIWYRKSRQLTILKARIKSATKTLETAGRMRLEKDYTTQRTRLNDEPLDHRDWI
jgi:hypothetical protein